MEFMNKKVSSIDKIILLVLLDVLTIQIASFLGLFLRFDFSFEAISRHYLISITNYTIYNTIITIIIFWIFRLYKSVWSYAGAKEFINIFIACTIASLTYGFGMNVVGYSMPRSYLILY